MFSHHRPSRRSILFASWRLPSTGRRAARGCALRFDARKQDGSGLVVWILVDELAFEGPLEDGLTQAINSSQICGYRISNALVH